MKDFRSRYFENYETELIPREGKRPRVIYRYKGNLVYWLLPKEKLTKKKSLIVLLQVSMIALYLWAGSYPSYQNILIQIAVPALLSLVPLLYETLGCIQLCFTKQEMKKPDFEDINRKLNYAPILHALLLLITFLFSLISVISLGDTLALPAAYFLCAVLSLIIRYLYRSIPYEEKEPAAHT